MKTSELTGAALDWAVARREFADRSNEELQELVKPPYRNYQEYEDDYDDDNDDEEPKFWFHPSSDWAQGGPIIDRERITICPNTDSTWWAVHPRTELEVHGATALQAAMRAYVHAKLGDEVEVPDELSAT